MAEKCKICGEKIKETFLGKLEGTIVKVKNKKKNKNELVYVCSQCQKQGKDKELKEIVK